MCDPVTAAAVITLAATTVSTVSGVQQATYQGRVADRNAKLANDASADAIERGRRESLQQNRATAQMQGQQVAAMAANGVEVGFGSSGEVLGDTARTGAEDAQIIRENFMRESKGYSIQAANYRSQASAARRSKVGIIASGVSSASSTILGGASQGGFGGGGGGGGPSDIVMGGKTQGGFF